MIGQRDKKVKIMSKRNWEGIEKVQAMAEKDLQYRQMMRDMRLIERKNHQVLAKLSGEDQNAICDFVAQCGEVSFRMLELACECDRK